MKSKKLIANLTAIVTILSMSSSFSGMSAVAADPADTSTGTYVLMNIPYDDFYKADIVNNVEVDTVASATKAKTRNGNLVAGSFHESPEGTDITGITYPVKVSDLSILSNFKKVEDTDKVSITVTNKGKTTTTDYEGKDTLFENNRYSYYVLGENETPENYKELTFDSKGNPTFSEIKGKSSQVLADASASITAGTKYGDYQISMSNLPFNGDKIYGVILETEDGKSYGLRHLENVWRTSELAWCTGTTKIVHGNETSSAHYKSMIGHTIKNIEYITSSGVYDINTSLEVPEYKFVLMNVPYADFYKSEVKNDVDVDIVTSATLNKTRTGTLVAGSYHVDSNGTDISGITYPVKVEASKLSRYKKVFDTDSLTITVKNRGKETTTEYVGKDTLFGNESYAYYELPAGEVPSNYKLMSFDENDKPSFGKITGEKKAQTLADATATITDDSKYGDYQISVANLPFTDETIYGVILTTDDNKSYALRHLENIWRISELAWCTGTTTTVHGSPTSSEHYKSMVGKKIKQIQYITSTGLYNITTDLDVLAPVTDTLVEAINNAQALNEADYKEEAWTQMQTALETAKKVLELPMSQKAVDEAAAALNDAVSALKKIVVVDNVTGFNVATTANAVKLTWDNVDNAVGYIVYNYDNTKKDWSEIARVSTNTYTATKLSSGTAYKFAVKAYALDEEENVLSTNYAEVSAVTVPDTVTGFKAAATSTSAVKLTWTKVKDATGYIVYRANAGKWVKVGTVKTNSFTNSKLKAGTSYKYAVKAYKTVSGKNYTSTKYPTVTTSTNPATVSFKLTAGAKKANVKWSKVAGATGYKIYYKTSKNGKWIGLKTTNNKTTSYTKTGLKKGKTYWFTVRAYKAANGKTYNSSFVAKSVKVK